MLEPLNHHFVSVELNLAEQIDVKPEDDILQFKAIDEGYVLKRHVNGGGRGSVMPSIPMSGKCSCTWKSLATLGIC